MCACLYSFFSDLPEEGGSYFCRYASKEVFDLAFHHISSASMSPFSQSAHLISHEVLMWRTLIVYQMSWRGQSIRMFFLINRVPISKDQHIL